jgi:hypothetical protein
LPLGSNIRTAPRAQMMPSQSYTASFKPCLDSFAGLW